MIMFQKNGLHCVSIAQQNRFDYTDFTGYRIIRLVRSRTVFCLITVYTDTVNFRRARAPHRMYRVIIEWVWQLQASSTHGATVQSRVQSIPRHSQTLDTRRICLYLSRWQARCFSVHTVMNLYLGLTYYRHRRIRRDPSPSGF